MRVNHAIFRTPNAVAPTLVERDTPKEYARENLGATMPMWRVQTEGYTEGSGQLIGMVSRDAGFLDSPDVEWISSGVNSKNSRAVAIGRHGNFFHWGFAASPTFLTDEAKRVFVNSVHYIAKFDGHGLIARKKQGTAMRSYVVDALERITEKGFAATLARHEQFVREDAKRRRAIQQRIDAGEQVSEMERRMLTYPKPRAPKRFDAIMRFIEPEAWKQIRNDEPAIRAYVTKALPFMRSKGWYELVVDKELQQFGVANNDVQLLPRLIAALDQDGGGSAQALLERYTDQAFKAKAQWAAWYRQNAANLFFTEAGGYKWLVNTRAGEAANWRRVVSEKGLPVKAADVIPLIRRKPTAKPGQASATRRASDTRLEEEVDDGDPVRATAKVKTRADGSHELRIDVAIDDGWHAYQAVPEGSPYTLMEVELDLPKGLTQKGKWQLPAAHPYAEDPQLIVYEGKITFRCQLTGKLPADLASIRCTVSYQVCDAEMCQPPTSVDVTPKQ